MKPLPQKLSLRSIAAAALLTVVFLLLALMVYVTQVATPLHIPLSLVLLYLSYKNLKKVLIYYVGEKSITTKSKSAASFFRAHKVIIGTVIIAVFIWHVIVSVIPNDREVFSGLTNDKQTEIVQEDVEVATVLLDKLALSGEKLLTNPGLLKEELSQEEGASLKKDWENFLLTSIDTESMTDRHRYFPQISLINNKETHVQSFVIAYALYIKKFEIFQKVIEKANTNPAAITVFNEYSDSLGAARLYDDVTGRFFASNSFFRRNLGYLYYRFVASDALPNPSPNYLALLDVSKTSYDHLFENMFSHITHRSQVYKRSFDQSAFDAWLPIQKNVFTNKIGNIHVGDRTKKFIEVSQIQEMKKVMQPGDILVHRKNWYASNLGIPGFWTHTGIYTGTLEDMDAFFASEFPKNGHASMSEYLKAEMPKAYGALSEKDKNGYVPSVVESQTHGTLIQSIESSASVDYFGVVRSRLSKAELLEVVLTGFGHYAKPYDFAFDLTTKSEVYCSELVYDAYLRTSKSKGASFPKALISGRIIVTPNAIVEKYVDELKKETRELDFVYFLDASEVTQKAFRADEGAFITTATRPKYSVGLE